MVNSKKMSKSTIAVIALSILLVLSLILTATGAWFTDTAGDSANTSDKYFGTVAINLDTTTGAGAWTKLGKHNDAADLAVVPGSEYHATWTIENTGTEDVYYRIVSSSITVTVGSHVMTADELEDAGITVQYKLGDAAMPAAEADYSGARKLLSGASNDFTVVVVVATTMPNQIRDEGDTADIVFNTKGATNTVVFNVAYSISIEAIQVANYTA